MIHPENSFKVKHLICNTLTTNSQLSKSCHLLVRNSKVIRLETIFSVIHIYFM